MTIENDDTTIPTPSIVIQSALLYTTSYGERRIRVTTYVCTCTHVCKCVYVVPLMMHVSFCCCNVHTPTTGTPSQPLHPRGSCDQGSVSRGQHHRTRGAPRRGVRGQHQEGRVCKGMCACGGMYVCMYERVYTYEHEPLFPPCRLAGCSGRAATTSSTPRGRCSTPRFWPRSRSRAPGSALAACHSLCWPCSRTEPSDPAPVRSVRACLFISIPLFAHTHASHTASHHTHTDVRIDSRATLLCAVRSMSLIELETFFRPRLIPVHEISQQFGKLTG
jgi:hypothetical protein